MTGVEESLSVSFFVNTHVFYTRVIFRAGMD